MAAQVEKYPADMQEHSQFTAAQAANAGDILVTPQGLKDLEQNDWDIHNPKRWLCESGFDRIPMPLDERKVIWAYEDHEADEYDRRHVDIFMKSDHDDWRKDASIKDAKWVVTICHYRGGEGKIESYAAGFKTFRAAAEDALKIARTPNMVNFRTGGPSPALWGAQATLEGNGHSQTFNPGGYVVAHHHSITSSIAYMEEQEVHTHSFSLARYEQVPIGERVPTVPAPLEQQIAAAKAARKEPLKDVMAREYREMVDAGLTTAAAD